MRNICFGRCCDHMIPSIHKVPACPFTGLYTVSHCTDDHISCIYCTVRHTCTAVVGCGALFLRKGPGSFISARFLHCFTGFFPLGDSFFFHTEQSCPLGRLRCRGLMFDTHPYYFFGPFKPLIEPFYESY